MQRMLLVTAVLAFTAHGGSQKKLRVGQEKVEHKAQQGHGLGWYSVNPIMGEGAYLSSEAVMEKTVDKNMHCEDAGESAEKWHECYEGGGDYLDGYKGKPPAKSAASSAYAISAVLATMILAQL